MSDKVYDEPGRGRKQCQNCKKYVWIKKATCPACNNPFPAKEQPEHKPEAQPILLTESPNPSRRRDVIVEATVWQPRPRLVWTPAYKCRVKLTATDPETVHNWVEELLGVYLADGLKLTLEAVKYFVRHFYDFHGPEHRQVCSLVEQHEFEAIEVEEVA